MKVLISKQVADFVRRQAPEPRRMLRRALEDLASERGDIKRLEGPLDEYCRLRVHGYRVILHYARGGRVECVFAERRSIVYEVFARALVDKIVGLDED